jgi:hypothetical protein
MKLDQPSIIILNRANVLQLVVVHQVVKTHSNAWWHNFADVWIVNGGPSRRWVDLISPVLQGTKARVLVMALPNNLSERDYSALITPGEASWLTSEYMEWHDGDDDEYDEYDDNNDNDEYYSS